MPHYRAPGVNVEETGTGVRPIEAASTSTVAFVGATSSGPFDTPTVVESLAAYVRVFGPVSIERPVSLAVTQFFANGGRRAYIVRVKRSATRKESPRSSEYVIGDADSGTGIHALRDAGPFGLLLTPDQAEMGVAEAGRLAEAALEFCEKRRIFYILDVPQFERSKQSAVRFVVDWAEQSTALRRPNAAVYFPRVSITDPSGKPEPVLVSPGGSIAGLYARTDEERGVWKAPAGVNAFLHGVSGSEIELTAEEMEQLQEASVNPLRQLDGQGTVAWGSRTFQPADSINEWRYVPVRRLALFIEESIYGGISWAVFEPNGEPLWARIRLAISSFMNQLFRAGAFSGASAGKAYFVECGHKTMTRADIENGRVVALVGFAPVKPAEFVVLGIQQKTLTED